jgi:cellobiose phosphorylase
VTPPAYLLSNGRYRVLLSDAGGGSSAWRDLALTRWAADATCDADGFFVFFRDLERGDCWSAGVQPLQCDSGRYDVRGEIGHADLLHERDGIGTRVEVAVAPDADVEYRRITLVNTGSATRRIQLTSYAEVSLNYAAADAGHPAFSKLFIQTERLRRPFALLAHRRPRSSQDPTWWMGHALVAELPGRMAAPHYETDRARFIGRGRTLAEPVALDPGRELSGTVGNVLDPILSLRHELVVSPGATTRVVALLAAGERREEVVTLLTRRRVARAGAVFREANGLARALVESLDIPPPWLRRLPSLTGALAYGVSRPGPALGLPPSSRIAPTDLQRLGVSGRAPLVFARLGDSGQLDDLGALISVVAWWRRSGMAVDLLIVTDGVPVPETVAARHVSSEAAPPQGMTVVIETPDVDPSLLLLADQYSRLTLHEATSAGLEPTPGRISEGPAEAPDFRPAAATVEHRVGDDQAIETLQFFNGLGGFAPNGAEYVIRLRWEDGHLRLPPQPWVNVVANESVGFMVSERGAGYTWSVNSRENRLTPWSNDPVLDPHGEAIYLRDEARDLYWSPLPGPAPGPGEYEVHHGFGYTEWRHTCLELAQETVVFVPRHDPVKLIRVRITNLGAGARRLSLFAYAEWVLGVLREESARLVVTTRDRSTGALLAANRHRSELGGRIAFAQVAALGGAGAVEHTGSRRGFLGRLGSAGRPRAVLMREPLDGRTGGGLEPCAGFRIPFELGAGARTELIFLLGEAESRDAAVALVRRYTAPERVAMALVEVQAFWRDLVRGVQIVTPSPAMDLLVNGWLTYQNLSCRMMGRSAFYQSGGAYGFRDQLQDAAALIHLEPALTRRQILLHAAHQFPEGDVLHWWHPPAGKGIRTRFSDDLLWLPHVTAGYLRHTGDAGILEEPVRFLDARPLAPGEDEALLSPETADTANVFEHCCRALDRSLTRGAHGLPLMGTGDWNDGMNRVGREGRGESVWLGFFLFDILDAFIPWCERRGDRARATRYHAYRTDLAAALNDAGWDGTWYRRAYYDDGAPLGSASSDECRIDAIAQAWAVMSGAAPCDRAVMALDAALNHLVSERDGIIRLLTPPFDRTPHDPGYIRGYLPGVRENGGQYTHGALWLVRALAEQGRMDQAARLLEMLSPVTRGATPAALATYQVEPYVIAADVYGAGPHVGRGGWTWYTGSAGWMFRVALESVLGVTMKWGTELVLRPCIPPEWPGFTVRYRLAGTETIYEIAVEQASPRPPTTTAVLDHASLEVLDGAILIPLRRDGALHRVRVELGGDVGPAYRPRLPNGGRAARRTQPPSEAPLVRITSE